jgi:hypothetical protein
MLAAAATTVIVDQSLNRMAVSSSSTFLDALLLAAPRADERDPDEGQETEDYAGA